MTPQRWTYPADLRESLQPFGLSPPDGTPPAVVRDALNDLYRYELRRLRDRLLAHEFERATYLDRVVVLRKRVLAADAAVIGDGSGFVGDEERAKWDWRIEN